MASRKTLKQNIKAICTELFAESVAISLYSENNQENIEALLFSVIKLEDDFVNRISHVEPGMKASTYFKDLIEKFNSQVSEIIDHINNIQ